MGLLTVGASPASAAPKLCANTYGGDVISASGGLKCAKARAVVRSWAGGYKADAIVDRSALGFACRGTNDSVEGLTIRCRQGRKAVRFYANVPV